MRIEIILFDGFDELDAVAPFEVLRHGAAAGADFDVALVGVDGPGTVQAANGLRVQVDSGLGRPDAVLVPGGGWLDGSSAGARAEATRGVLTSSLAELAPALRWTASVCTGAMLLAEAGLLRGRSATTNHGAIDQLPHYGASARIERVVDDGPVITAGGPSAGLDLGLWIIEREAGRAIADAAAAEIEYVRQGVVWRAPVPATRQLSSDTGSGGA